MDLQVVDIDRNTARRAFLEYRDSVRALTEREIDAYDEKRREAIAELRQRDEAIMKGYRQIALGRQVISLRDTIIAGGEDEARRPRLAVARADFQGYAIRMTRAGNGSVKFWGGSHNANHRDARTLKSWDFRAGTFPAIATMTAWQTIEARAIVPMIPPRFRPALTDRYAILFEADWKGVPADPALLRALGDGLYVVLATWDLTALERAVLGG